MKDKNKLGKYLIGSFLLVLFGIGILQLITTSILNFSLLPYMEKALGLDGLLTDQNYGTMFSVIFKCLIFVIIRSFASSASIFLSLTSNYFFTRFFGQEFIDRMVAINEEFNDTTTLVYVLKVILFLVILLVLWAVPYIFGAFLYSKIVRKRVDELEEKRKAEELEYARRRNLLLSDVAHDIKTPVTTVAGFSRALADGTVPEDLRQDYLNSVYEKSMKVSDLVTLLFEYVKLDSEGYSLKKEPTDFCEMVRSCIAMQYADFEDKDMEIELNIPDRQIMVNADKVQFERAINNILINTIRHNPEKTKVFIDVDTEGGMAVLSISDMGVRIEKETALHLFDPFVQGDKSRTSRSGSGLGLSISKKIADMHNGRVVLIQYNNVEKYKKVKTFKISLPAIS